MKCFTFILPVTLFPVVIIKDLKGINLMCPPNFQDFGAYGETLVQFMCSYYLDLTPIMNLKITQEKN